MMLDWRTGLTLLTATILCCGCCITVRNEDSRAISDVTLSKETRDQDGKPIWEGAFSIVDGDVEPGQSVRRCFLSPGTYKVYVRFVGSWDSNLIRTVRIGVSNPFEVVTVKIR